jgi:hypothetical protein
MCEACEIARCDRLRRRKSMAATDRMAVAQQWKSKEGSKHPIQQEE